MQISNSYNPYLNPYMNGTAAAPAARSAQAETPSASFADYLDQVSISREARQKTISWDYGDNLASVASDLKAYNQMNNENRYNEENLDKWLPENRARLEKIYEEMEKLDAADGYPDPSTRSDASTKKMWDLTSQRKVLEVYGEKTVVTDKMMAVGAAAYREAEREWGEANGWQVDEWAQEGKNATAELIKMLAGRNYRKPEELEEQLKEWRNGQLVDNRDIQTKKGFKEYMDKALGREKPGAAKSPEEKIKELTAKIKTLQTRLSEVAANESLPAAAKSNQVESLNSQINALHAQISELGKQIAESAAAPAAEG